MNEVADIAPRISVVMPYWNRRKAMELTLANFANLYGIQPTLEVVIVDDGSMREPIEEVKAPEYAEWCMTLVKLEPHERPRNSAAAIVAGLQHARGEMIVLQNVETTHETAILPELFEQVQSERASGLNPYIVCSCIDGHSWYEHPRYRKKGFHWCVAAHRETWARVDELMPEWLMEGHCYEDNVLRNLMVEAGADFSWRTDLVVRHHKALQDKWGNGQPDHWDGALVSINRARYMEWRNHHTLAKLAEWGVTGE